MTNPPVFDRPDVLPSAGTILVIDHDRDICEVVEAILSDSGYGVRCLAQLDPEAVAAAVSRLEPDCVLLDGSSPTDYGESWEQARRLTVRGRRVPVIMFTTHPASAREAEASESVRSQAAGFSGVLTKPFNLEELLEAVAKAVGESVPFDRSPRADALRTQALVEQLRASGARDIHRSTLREWVTFRAPSGRLVQLYWWEARGIYYCGGYDEQSAAMQTLGYFSSRDEAVACALAG